MTDEVVAGVSPPSMHPVFETTALAELENRRWQVADEIRAAGAGVQAPDRVGRPGYSVSRSAGRRDFARSTIHLTVTIDQCGKPMS